MDVAIIVDTSSSVSRRNFDIVKNFLSNLVSGLPVAYRMAHVSVIHYNHRSYLDWDFRSDYAQNLTAFREAILKLIYYGGGTRTDKALEMASAKVFKSSGGSRSYVPHVLLVITDGKTSPKSKPYSVVLKPLKVIILQPRSEGSNPCLSGVGEGRALRERGWVYFTELNTNQFRWGRRATIFPNQAFPQHAGPPFTALWRVESWGVFHKLLYISKSKKN